jgi:hypothetical protein
LDAAATVGAAFVPLVLAPAAWTHRRVETVDVLTFEIVRRRMSVDFTVPAELRDQLAIRGMDQSLVPLATLRKQPLRHFDLRDEGGRAVPVLGREHNGTLAWAVLLWAASNVENVDELSPDIVGRLGLIANAPSDDAREALDQLDADAEGDPDLAKLLAALAGLGAPRHRARDPFGFPCGELPCGGRRARGAARAGRIRRRRGRR